MDHCDYHAGMEDALTASQAQPQRIAPGQPIEPGQVWLDPSDGELVRTLRHVAGELWRCTTRRDPRGPSTQH